MSTFCCTGISHVNSPSAARDGVKLYATLATAGTASRWSGIDVSFLLRAWIPPRTDTSRRDAVDSWADATEAPANDVATAAAAITAIRIKLRMAFLLLKSFLASRLPA